MIIRTNKQNHEFLLEEFKSWYGEYSVSNYGDLENQITVYTFKNALWVEQTTLEKSMTPKGVVEKLKIEFFSSDDPIHYYYYKNSKLNGIKTVKIKGADAPTRYIQRVYYKGEYLRQIVLSCWTKEEVQEYEDSAESSLSELTYLWKYRKVPE